VLFWVFKKEFLLSSKMVLTWNSQTKTFLLSKDKNLSKPPKNNDFKDYILKNGEFKITQSGNILWESSDDWYVTGFSFSDVTNDGLPEVSLSVWKKGNFGVDKPFWVKENDQSERNHFFVFQFEDKTMKPIWQSSNLEAPNCEFVVVDLDNDNKNELVTVEGEYTSGRICQGKYLAVWKWNGWGFSNEWRSEKGNFGNLTVKEIDGRRLVGVTVH
jgi:hypothetical protein